MKAVSSTLTGHLSVRYELSGFRLILSQLIKEVIWRII